jgi:hypothetical protein
MPYIKAENREKFNVLLDELSDKINSPGELNYVIYYLMCKLAKPSPSYRIYSALLTELECCKLEFYRRQMVPYEDKKKKENGDIKI